MRIFETRVMSLVLGFTLILGGCSQGKSSQRDSIATRAPTVAEAELPHTYTFGVVPQWDPKRLEEAWTPFLQQVAQESGLDLKFATAPTIAEYHKRATTADYDFVYINPNQYVRVSGNYTAFARQSNKQLKGILASKKGSEVKTVADLRGKRVALPSGAFAATMINKLVIAQADIDLEKDVTLMMVDSHEQGYRLVAQGKADAAGGVGRTFKAMPDRLRSKLEVFHTSEGYTSHPMAAKGTVPAEAIKKLQAAVVKVSNDPKNQQLMKSIRLANGLTAVTDADYSDQREFSELAALMQIHE